MKIIRKKKNLWITKFEFKFEITKSLSRDAERRSESFRGDALRSFIDDEWRGKNDEINGSNKLA